MEDVFVVIVDNLFMQNVNKFSNSLIFGLIFDLACVVNCVYKKLLMVENSVVKEYCMKNFFQKFNFLHHLLVVKKLC